MDTNQKERGRRPAPKQGSGKRPAQPSAKRPAQAAGKGPAPKKNTASRPAQQRRSRTQAQADAERSRRARQNREAAKARQRQEARARKRRKAAKRPVPAVVYTQPAAFNRSRLAMQLLIVTAVVLALVMGLSIFFKVETITVSGANVYSEWVIREASGISEGDNLLTFSIPRACGRIIAELPYVKNVRIGIKLPDTVNIIIEEEDVVYAIQSSDALWWLITSEGKVVQQTDGGTAGSYTKIEGVTLESPLLNEQAVAMEVPIVATAETDPDGNIIGTEPVIVTNAERLEIALQILRELEANDIVGEAASVNVTDIGDIELWYGQKYQVKLGDTSNLSKKIASMYSVINSSEMTTGYGVLDITFTTWPDKVGYTPFE